MRKILPIVVLILGLHVYLLITLKFTAWPEMTFWPYLILKGWLPYRDIAIAHTPVLLAKLTVFYKIFGMGLMQLKVFTWMLIIATDLLLFWVVNRIWGNKVALLTLIIYIPLQLFYEGNGLWFDLALTPLALFVFYNLTRKNYFWAGIFWGISLFTKQTAVWFLIPVIYTFVRGPLKEAPLRVIDPSGSVTFKVFRKFILGVGTVSILIFVALLILGIWGDFWLWTMKFGIMRLPVSSGQIHFPSIRQFMIATSPLIFSALFLWRLKKSLNLVAWGLFASLGVLPRWELFHFQPALPFVAIGLAIALQHLPRLNLRWRMVFGVGLLLIAVIFLRQLIRDWGGQIRFFEPKVLNVANYIRQNTKASDEIYVVNAWDNLYVLTDTLPATRPWLPNLSWYMEIPGIQDLIVADLQLNPAKLIVQGEYQETGLGAYKPEKINDFILGNYKLKDKIDGYLIYIPRQ